MPTKKHSPEPSWADPDDAPAWSEAMFDRAELRHGDTILREAAGTVTKRGRPRLDAPKRQVSVRLDPSIIDELKRANPQWQVAMMEVLGNWAKHRRAKRLTKAKDAASGTEPAKRRAVVRRTGT
jgi:uncharacterized protein (DUF4415 family)